MSDFDPKSLLQGTSFEPNAILRGAQLTLVGAHRALQNPGLFTSEHYRQAASAVAAGIAIRLLVAIPVCTTPLALLPTLPKLTHPQDPRHPPPPQTPQPLHRPQLGRRANRRHPLHRRARAPNPLLPPHLHALPLPGHGPHVHGLPLLGRPDLHRQAPGREAGGLTRDVLSEFEDV